MLGGIQVLDALIVSAITTSIDRFQAALGAVINSPSVRVEKQLPAFEATKHMLVFRIRLHRCLSFPV